MQYLYNWWSEKVVALVMWVHELWKGGRDRRHFIHWFLNVETMVEEKGIWAVCVMFANCVMTLLMQWSWLPVVEVIVGEGICNELCTELSKNTVCNIAQCCLVFWTLWLVVFFFSLNQPLLLLFKVFLNGCYFCGDWVVAWSHFIS